MNYVKRLIMANKELAGISSQLELFACKLEDAAKNGRIIFSCGNGGSASDSDHISGELLKSFIIKRRLKKNIVDDFVKYYGEDGIKISDKLEEGIKSISIGSFQAFLSAYSNDVDWEMAYAQFLYVMGSKGDVIIGISCSGNAKNVLNAFKVAKVKGIYSILLTGENEGICVNYCDLCIKVPERDTYRIQEYHSMIYHAVCAEVERRIFSE
ncbi:MAG TPA: SIS domain-containing protein [Victivallales bacterium]|nr:SIS domain-containing protein [Victivallales bacterium]